MDAVEFADWLEDFGVAFPDTYAWLENLKRRQDTLEQWAGVLSTVDLQDAKTVTRRMLAGEYDRPKAYEREEIPSTVKRLAARVRAIRSAPVAGDELPSYMLSRKQGWKSADAYRGAIEEMKLGNSIKEALANLIPADPDDEQPTYRCLDCKDSGIVTVWHTKSMKAMESGRFDEPGQRITGVTRCPCQAGKRFEWMTLWYDPEKWVRCDDVKDPDSVNRLQHFMETRKPAGWTPEFADFNTR